MTTPNLSVVDSNLSFLRSYFHATVVGSVSVSVSAQVPQSGI